jgi:hypothetical protein
MAVNPVPCADCGSGGAAAADPVVNTAVSTGVRRIAGIPVQTLKANHPGLQSVTLVVLAGTVIVTTTDGLNQPIPVGVSLTWSVNDTDDSSLANWTCVGSASEADYLLAFTYKAAVDGA